MANLGTGIGSFLEGLSKGMALKRQQDRQDLENKFTERKMNLLETREARDAELDAFKLKKAQADFDYEQSERSADAPLHAAKRKSIMSVFADQEGEREAKRAAGAEADRAVKSGKYASFDEAFREVSLPKLQQYYLSRGDTKTADAFMKWGNDKRVQKGVDTFGKALTAINIGDWGGANKALNDLVGDENYMALDGYEIKGEPIKDDGGKTIGIRGTFKNRNTGESSTRDFTDLGEFGNMFSGLLNPQAVFEWNVKQYEASLAAKAERSKGLNKLADDITLEREKSRNRLTETELGSRRKIEEQRAKAEVDDPREISKEALKLIGEDEQAGGNLFVVPETDANGRPTGKQRRMTYEEKIDAAIGMVKRARSRAADQGYAPAPAGQPSPSRPNSQGVTPQAATPRSIMGPAGAPGAQAGLTPPRRQLQFYSR